MAAKKNLERGANPIVFTQESDVYPFPCNVTAVIFEGSGSADDLARLDHGDGKMFWMGRATTTSVYQGVSFFVHIKCPFGLVLADFDSTGSVTVYLR